MKIQMICQHYYPEQYPLTKICSDLVKKGHDVSILTGLPNYPEGHIYNDYKFGKNRKQVIDGVKINRCFLIPRGKSKAGLFLNYISFAVSSMIKALFLKKDFDAILVIQSSPVTMAMPGMVLKKLSKKPFYIYSFDLWPESLVSGGVASKSFIYKMVLKLSEFIYKSADKIFISSRKFESYFNEVLKIKDNIHYLPFYADESFLDIKNKISDDKTINLVFAGNVGKMQSVKTIVYAANEIKKNNIKFHIVGDGSALSSCKELADKLETKNIKFYGRMDFSKMPEVYAMADAMLITLADNKLISYTLPNKVLSYMAAGKPIIASASGEIKNIIKEAKCGFTADSEDYIGLKNAILRFIKSSDKMDLAKNAKNYYNNNFTIDIFIKRLFEFMKQD